MGDMDGNEEYQLWQVLEHKLFHPHGTKAIHAWLRNFHRFLPFLWGHGMPDWSKPIRHNAGFQSDIPFPQHINDPFSCRPRNVGVGFSYQIREDLSSFCLRLFWGDAYLSLDLDNRYLFEHRVGTESCPKPLSNDLANLFDKRISHPGLHTHIGGGNASHDLRFGLCSRNPFLLLYQAAYQLCPPALQENEKGRFTQVVTTQWQHPEIKIF